MPTSILSRLSKAGTLDAVYADSLRPFEGELRAERLMADAERATGLSDWGGERWQEEGFRARFGALCRSLETEAQVTPVGRSRAHGRIHVMLCSRLRVVAYHAAYPDIGPIVSPLIGAGFPRSGTSFLQELLSQDPDSLSAVTAQAMIPVPPAGIIVDESERIALVRRMLAFQGVDAPEVNAVHPFDANASTEDVEMQEAACGTSWTGFFDVPTYRDMVIATSADLYGWQKGMMQILQIGRADRRWVLKAPEHLRNWQLMLDTFPDAKMFINHRDPGRIVPSTCSLLMTFRRLSSTGTLDPKTLGPPMLAGLMAGMNEVMAWRAAHPEVVVIDVHYQALVNDPIGEVRRLYAGLNLQLTAAAEQRMTDFLKRNRHGQAEHGAVHRYSLADFGLTEAMIEETCRPYLDHYGISRENRV